MIKMNDLKSLNDDELDALVIEATKEQARRRETEAKALADRLAQSGHFLPKIKERKSTTYDPLSEDEKAKVTRLHGAA